MDGLNPTVNVHNVQIAGLNLTNTQQEAEMNTNTAAVIAMQVLSNGWQQVAIGHIHGLRCRYQTPPTNVMLSTGEVEVNGVVYAITAEQSIVTVGQVGATFNEGYGISVTNGPIFAAEALVNFVWDDNKRGYYYQNRRLVDRYPSDGSVVHPFTSIGAVGSLNRHVWGGSGSIAERKLTDDDTPLGFFVAPSQGQPDDIVGGEGITAVKLYISNSDAAGEPVELAACSSNSYDNSILFADSDIYGQLHSDSDVVGISGWVNLPPDAPYIMIGGATNDNAVLNILVTGFEYDR